MKLSIAMTSCNGERFIGEQLESFANQTRLPDELIVCDDASDDGTVTILRDFQARAPFPTHVQVNERRKGYVGNFEQAVRMCAGDVIFLSDHDDCWLPEKLAEHEKRHAGESQVGLVVSNGLDCDEDLSPKGTTQFGFAGLTADRIERIHDGGLFNIVLRTPRLFGCAMSFRSSLQEVALPIPATYTHDTWLAIALSIFTETRCIETPMMLYRSHARQTVGVTREKTLGAAPRSLRLREIEAERGALQDLLNRVRQFRDRVQVETADRRIEGKIAHLEALAGIGGGLPDRVAAVGGQVLSGGYFRYSTKSVLRRDLRLMLRG